MSGAPRGIQAAARRRIGAGDDRAPALEVCMTEDLNSILLEGKLRGGLILHADGVCAFVLESKRSRKEGEKTETDVFYFNVETSGKLAEVCSEYLKDGRGVRVVGRLVQELRPDKKCDLRSRVLVKAEHVEFKPQHAAAEHAEAVAV
jgi:single-strand DNA-binding protein